MILPQHDEHGGKAPKKAGEADSQPPPLTKRDVAIVDAILSGCSYRDLSERFGSSRAYWSSVCSGRQRPQIVLAVRSAQDRAREELAQRARVALSEALETIRSIVRDSEQPTPDRLRAVEVLCDRFGALLQDTPAAQQGGAAHQQQGLTVEALVLRLAEQQTELDSAPRLIGRTYPPSDDGDTNTRTTPQPA